ncbi:MAG: hypothetical protein IKD04_02535 [Clostridia bacterium]|nr:hypothetical protein [Clostridia bacterium]
MFHNIKADILYYKTNSDFEMEFNLCGCCRMRLLTDKISDKKSLVLGLARAVSRSRVIIIAGSLFGEDGVIGLAAEAIGKGMKPVDNQEYHISADEEIQIIEGAIPLITADGYFGGCIIESGPQTMILLTENKSIRKTVMQTLIHPYIEELCAADMKESADAANAGQPTEEEAEQATEQLNEEPSEEQSPTEDGAACDQAEEADAEQEQTEADGTELIIDQEENAEPETDISDEEITLTKGMIFEADDGYLDFSSEGDEEVSDIYVEPQKMRRRDAKAYNDAYSDLPVDDSDLVTDGNFKSKAYRESPLNLSILVLTVVILVLLAVLCYCIFYVPTKDGVSAANYLRDIYNTLFGA